MDANKAFNILKLEKKFPVTREQLKKAYIKQVKLNHPDAGGSTEKMIQINNAYEYLESNLEGINEYNLNKNKPSEMVILADKFVERYMQTNSVSRKKQLIESFYVSLKGLKNKEGYDSFTDMSDLFRMYF
jgi:curved DNA-binding protein CbpA